MSSKLAHTIWLLAITLVLSTSATANSKDAYPEKGIHRIIVSTVTETTATILWLSDDIEKGEVCSWTQDNKVICKTETESTTDHRIELTGLQSNSTYHFYIRGKLSVSYLHHFQTVKPLNGKPDFTMAILADPQFGEKRQPMTNGGQGCRGVSTYQKVVKKINQQNPDFVIFPGDLVEFGCREDFKIFKKLSDELTMPYYVAVGNHERLDKEPDNRIAYKQIFALEKEYYSKDICGRHFIFLEPVASEHWRPDKQQFDWLKKDLNENKNKDVYVIVHYAVANDPYVFDKDRGFMPEVKKLLESHGRVRAVYNGHKNVTSVTIQNGILYASCPQILIGPRGYLLVTVYPDGLVQTFYNTPEIGHPLKNIGPNGPLIGQPDAGKVRWDSLYRCGRQPARNYSWRFDEPFTSTGLR